MSRPFQRTDRLKSLFQQELSRLFYQIKSPLLEGQSIQIVELDLAKDLSSSRVYISVLDKQAEISVINLLQEKAPWMRSQIGKKMHIKKIPKFIFVQDDSIAKASYINALLSKVKDDTIQ